MFGMMEAMLSFLRRQVGLRTDAASATGSLHAKIAYLKDTTIPGRQAPRGPAGAFGSFSTSQPSYQTALNVSGRGSLIGLVLTGQNDMLEHAYVKLTVDGYALAESHGPDAGNIAYPELNYLFGGLNFSASGDPRNAEIEFKSSLKIELKNVNHNTCTIKWLYTVE
jgi:hypothetical protein